MRALPCPRPPLTPTCARCGHWLAEHDDDPQIHTSCTQYELLIGRALFALPEHAGITYSWVRRMGRTRYVLQITEPDEQYPGGELVVHRYPAPGDGRPTFTAHRYPIKPGQRSRTLAAARARVRRD
jgi:hypothetical protein